MVIERWNLVRSMMERTVDTMVLVLWRFLKHLPCRVHISSEQSILHTDLPPQMSCGPKFCSKDGHTGRNILKCGPAETCVVDSSEKCFTPPCLSVGRCQYVELYRVQEEIQPLVSPDCQPDSARASPSCVVLTLIFDMKLLPVVRIISHR